MGGSHRRGRFRAVGQINAVAVMGGDEIDLGTRDLRDGVRLAALAIDSGRAAQVLSRLQERFPK